MGVDIPFMYVYAVLRNGKSSLSLAEFGRRTVAVSCVFREQGETFRGQSTIGHPAVGSDVQMGETHAQSEIGAVKQRSAEMALGTRGAVTQSPAQWSQVVLAQQPASSCAPLPPRLTLLYAHAPVISAGAGKIHEAAQRAVAGACDLEAAP